MIEETSKKKFKEILAFIGYKIKDYFSLDVKLLPGFLISTALLINSVISSTLKALRKEHGLTKVDLAMKSGVGLNFVRELEQGKATVRMDKVAQVFDLFGYELVPQKKVK